MGNGLIRAFIVFKIVYKAQNEGGYKAYSELELRWLYLVSALNRLLLYGHVLMGRMVPSCPAIHWR